MAPRPPRLQTASSAVRNSTRSIKKSKHVTEYHIVLQTWLREFVPMKQQPSDHCIALWDFMTCVEKGEFGSWTRGKVFARESTLYWGNT